MDACKTDGVNALYMIDKSVPTGTCAVCITGNDRSLVANLSAANNYKATHTKENMSVVSGAKIIYSAGFFATVSPEAIELASTEAAKTGATYCMNLSAPFLMQVPPFKAVFDPKRQGKAPVCGHYPGCRQHARCTPRPCY